MRMLASQVLGCIPHQLFLGTCLSMSAIATFGFASLNATWIQDFGPLGSSPQSTTDLAQILSSNVGAALVLYSGIITFGFTTIIAAGILSLYLGATISVGLHSVGAVMLMSDVIWYVPFEFTGLALSATAGIQPLSGIISRCDSLRKSTRGWSFGADVIRSLGTITVALIFILCGALIELIVIQVKV